MTLRQPLTLALAVHALACSAPPVGDPSQDTEDTGFPQTDTASTSSTATTSATASETTTAIGSESGEPESLCPDGPPGACIGDLCLSETCGGPWSTFDADGCPRQSCTADGEACPSGRTCVVPGDYGDCRPSRWSCSEEANGACACGGTADCNAYVGSCVPDEERPPAVVSCAPSEPAVPAFALHPRPDEDSLTTGCEITDVDPLILTCASGFAEATTLTLNTSEAPLLVVGQTVQLEYWTVSAPDWESSWLRILSSETPTLIAVQADTLTPPDVAPEQFWPLNVEVEAGAATGCPEVDLPCSNAGDSTAGRAASILFNDAPLLSAMSGEVPPAVGTEHFFATVGHARSGPGCEPFLAQQSAWYSFVLQRAVEESEHAAHPCGEPGQPIVGSRDCALLASRLRFSFEECQSCQGMPCGSVEGCYAPCVDDVHVYQGCCDDTDCNGVSGYCAAFAGSPHDSCVDDDPE